MKRDLEELKADVKAAKMHSAQSIEFLKKFNMVESAEQQSARGGEQSASSSGASSTNICDNAGGDQGKALHEWDGFIVLLLFFLGRYATMEICNRSIHRKSVIFSEYHGSTRLICQRTPLCFTFCNREYIIYNKIPQLLFGKKKNTTLDNLTRACQRERTKSTSSSTPPIFTPVNDYFESSLA